IHAGDLYYATPERVFFDGHVMMQVGVYRGVPVYADATVEPHSIVYVPVAAGMLRRYERRRAGPLAGTEGSRTPGFPVESARVTQTQGREMPPGISADQVLPPPPPLSAIVRASIPAIRRAPAEPKPQTSMNGVWVEYDGSRWYSAGPAVQAIP